MRIKFNGKQIRGLLFCDNTRQLCDSEADKVFERLKNSKSRYYLKKSVSIKRSRYGVAIRKPCLNKKMLENARGDMLDALRK